MYSINNLYELIEDRIRALFGKIDIRRYSKFNEVPSNIVIPNFFNGRPKILYGDIIHDQRFLNSEEQVSLALGKLVEDAIEVKKVETIEAVGIFAEPLIGAIITGGVEKGDRMEIYVAFYRVFRDRCVISEEAKE